MNALHATSGSVVSYQVLVLPPAGGQPIVVTSQTSFLLSPGPVAGPFNGDKYLREAVSRLIRDYGIQTVVETGTFHGETSLALSEMAGNVHTIEIDPAQHALAARKLASRSNIHLNLGSSPDVLDRILDKLERPILFYLDAHWGQHCPLREEIQTIARHGIPDSVIVIHDFYNPLHPDFGFDTYDHRLDWDYIKEQIEAVYKGQHTLHYNDKAGGARRGVAFIAPAPATERASAE